MNDVARAAGLTGNADDAAPEPTRSEIEIAARRASEGDIRALRRSVGLILLLMCFTSAYFARDLILPLVLGVLIALVLSPAVRGLERLGISPVVSAILLIGALVIGVGTGSYVLSGPVTNLAGSAPEMLAQAQDRLRGVMDTVEQMQEVGDQVSEITDGATDGSGTDDTVAVVAERRNVIAEAAGGLVSVVTTLVASTVLALFILASGDLFTRRIVEASPRLKDKKRALTIIHDLERQISRYLAAVTAINAGLGLCIGASLWALGMPSAAVWGVAAFLLNFIPFIGAAAGVALVTVVAIVTFDTLSYALLAPLIYFALTTLEGNVVTPALIGRRLEINTVAVLVAVIVWVWIWGIPGALLAVPILVVAKVICDNTERLQPIGRFLSGSS